MRCPDSPNSQFSVRLLVLLTAATVVVAGVLAPESPARAAACGSIASGDGSSADPWLIATIGDLLTLTTTRCTGPGNQSYFTQNADLTLTSNVAINQPDLVRYDGGRYTVTISGVTGFNGLFTGTNNATITRLVVNSSSSTLASGKGWVADTDTGSTFSFIVTNGAISTNGGGIVGAGALDTTIEDSFTSGAIGSGAGGLIGKDGGKNRRTVTIRRSHSSGQIGSNGGGLAGYQSGSVVSSILVTDSYSTGDIGDNGGGIIGGYWGLNGGLVRLSRVFSTGAISGDGAGGLSGGYTTANASGVGDELQITDSYTTGAISGQRAGGLVGRDSGILGGTITISNSYTTGAITGLNSGGLVGQLSSTGAIITVSNSYTTGASASTTNGYVADSSSTHTLTATNSYSEAANSASGWSDSRAATVLTGTPSPTFGTKWASCVANQPYFLSSFYPRNPCLQSPMATISGSGPSPASLTVADPGTYTVTSTYDTDPLSYVSLVGSSTSVGGTTCSASTDCRLPDVLQAAESGATITGSGTVQVMRYDSTTLRSTLLGTLSLLRPQPDPPPPPPPTTTTSSTTTTTTTVAPPIETSTSSTVAPVVISRITARLIRRGRAHEFVIVRGQTSGIVPGSKLTSRIWFFGSKRAIKGSTARVKADGSFVWTLRTTRRISVYLIAPSGVRSRKLSG